MRHDLCCRPPDPASVVMGDVQYLKGTLLLRTALGTWMDHPCPLPGGYNKLVDRRKWCGGVLTSEKESGVGPLVS